MKYEEELKQPLMDCCMYCDERIWNDLDAVKIIDLIDKK